MGKRSHSSMSASEQLSSPEDSSTRPDDSSKKDEGHMEKTTVIDPSLGHEAAMMQCRLPPHSAPVNFESLESFEVHYSQAHTNRCVACGRNFPSAHFLNLHLDELHNPVREALAAKGEKTYSCLVDGCDKKCSAPSKRRLHLIDKHGFPKLYDFRVIEHGIDAKRSLLREGRRRRVSTATDPPLRQPHRTSISSELKPSNSTPTIRVQSSNANVNNDVSRGQVGAHVSSKDPDGLNTNKDSEHNDSIRELETSLSALHFVPRSVISRQSKSTEPKE